MKNAELIILAITGATGMVYVPPFLRILNENGVRVHGIISDAGRKVLRIELGMEPSGLPGVERWFGVDEFTAPAASGSSLYDALVILPCTVGTMGAIANGYCANLIHRAADVTLKERRPLILAVRETPLNRTHLHNMLALTDAGAIIFPPMPSFYHKPGSLEDMANHFAGRLCDHLGIKASGMKRWEG
ncbi:MAG: UbiX family flavin prenyltransferase [Desulfobulbaceae bacterium]|nr:UbiX family flavin prenyltransferase [Desulfobulbaceae bacterium]